MQEIIKLLKKLIEEAQFIGNESLLDVDAGWKRIERWERRCKALLSQNISKEEADNFDEASGTRLAGDPEDNFTGYVKAKMGFLEALEEDMVTNPGFWQDKLKAPESITKKNAGGVASDKKESLWDEIHKEFDISKEGFGRKIEFVKELYTRTVIFRDVGDAYKCFKNNLYKPSVILSGGVIEELLRWYLKSKINKLKCHDGKPIEFDDRGNEVKNNKNGKVQTINFEQSDFYKFINLCRANKLLRKTSGLSDTARIFRNMVHIKEEKTKDHAIQKSTASLAINSIFTLARDCQID